MIYHGVGGGAIKGNMELDEIFSGNTASPAWGWKCRNRNWIEGDRIRRNET